MGQPSTVAPFKKPDTAPPAAAKPRRKFLRQNELVDLVKAYQPDAQEDELNKAYVFAVMKHGQQLRHSGDPYFAHPVAVAGLLTDLKLDQSTIIAGLLHDVVEDTDVSVDEIRSLFGEGRRRPGGRRHQAAEGHRQQFAARADPGRELPEVHPRHDEGHPRAAREAG